GIPRFEVDHMRSGVLVRRLFNRTYDRVPDDYREVRFATSFNVPSDFKPGDYLYIKITGGDDNWVQCDGVQLVKGNTPTIYYPNNDLYQEIEKIKEQRILWAGVLYLLNTHTVVPDKRITDCKNG